MGRLLPGLVEGSALGFFLCAFQVHESGSPTSFSGLHPSFLRARLSHDHSFVGFYRGHPPPTSRRHACSERTGRRCPAPHARASRLARPLAKCRYLQVGLLPGLLPDPLICLSAHSYACPRYVACTPSSSATAYLYLTLSFRPFGRGLSAVSPGGPLGDIQDSSPASCSGAHVCGLLFAQLVLRFPS